MSRRCRHPTTLGAASALTVSALFCTALLLGGCASGPVMAPDLSATARPSGFERIGYPADGVTLAVPSDWTVSTEPGPLIAVYSSGPATIALWRFPRRPAQITTTAQLQRALAGLIRAALSRDPSFRVQHTGLSRVSGAGAVIIDALEHVGHELRRVRTEHVYARGAELVLDAYAPPAQFPTVDHDVFSPVRRSLRLLNGGRIRTGPVSTSTSTPTAPKARTTPPASP